MRLLTILAGYAASSVAAMVVLVLFGWIDSGSLSLDRIGYIAPVFAGGAASGAFYALPIALPVMIFTELTRKSSPWIFVAAGFATAAVLIGFLGNSTLGELIEGQPYAVRDVLVVTAASLAASLTYWLVVWKILPPKTTTQGDAVSS